MRIWTSSRRFGCRLAARRGQAGQTFSVNLGRSACIGLVIVLCGSRSVCVCDDLRMMFEAHIFVETLYDSCAQRLTAGQATLRTCMLLYGSLQMASSMCCRTAAPLTVYPSESQSGPPVDPGVSVGARADLAVLLGA